MLYQGFRVLVPFYLPLCYNIVGLVKQQELVLVPFYLPLCYNLTPFSLFGLRVLVPFYLPLCYNKEVKLCNNT